jgi:hypothetical protein
MKAYLRCLSIFDGEAAILAIGYRYLHFKLTIACYSELTLVKAGVLPFISRASPKSPESQTFPEIALQSVGIQQKKGSHLDTQRK